MLRQRLQTLVSAAVDNLISEGRVPDAVREAPIEIIDTKQPEHGDYACNFAMVASKKAGMNPRQLGEMLKEGIHAVGSDLVDEIEVAGPGFLNFRLSPAAIASFVPEVLALGDQLPKTTNPQPLKINVEFVSVNPNGPITIGSGRGAAYGSTLCNVLQAAGNKVHREYYINDGTNSEQMRQFAESVRSLLLGEPVPEKGYKGDYVQDVADSLKASTLNGSSEGAIRGMSAEEIQKLSEQQMISAQREALTTFGTTFDTWFSEQSLHLDGTVAQAIEELTDKGAADEEAKRTILKMGRGGVIEEVRLEVQSATSAEDDEDEPAGEAATSAFEGNTLWLRSTKFGDDMDRVLRRRDGRLTYIASDVAYHRDKFNRPPNTDKLITILGPDHHGYIARLQAVLAALFMKDPAEFAANGAGAPLDENETKIYRSPEERDACKAALAEAREKLEVQIYQLVRFMKDGKPAPMRKRDGNIYALIDLMREIGEKVKPSGTEDEKLAAGRDVARFFYLMRSHDTTFDFDLDLAEKQSDENPVFYAQYAHARICSVLRKAGESKLDNSGRLTPEAARLLTHPRESALIKKILDLPEEVRRCAEDYGVHRLTTYVIELARTYHHFYDACRVIQPDQPELSAARLGLCQATRIALKATFDLLGVSAPERMEREEAIASAETTTA